MSTKADQDGEVHSYFSHYHSPYEAFINYMNIVNDFGLEVKGTPETPTTKRRLKYELRTSDVPKWATEYEESYGQYEGLFI
jgi:alpha-amylase